MGAVEMLQKYHGPEFSPTRHAGQVARLSAVLADHPDARLEMCSDEKTGHRYGRAKCRAGQCARIGGTTFVYQLWAVWP